jgi:hypothetical protein
MKPSSTVHVLLIALSLLFGTATPHAQDKPATAQAAAQFQIPATDDGLPGVGPIRRADWFRKLWQERRTKWAARVEKDRNAVVLLGDSITHGFPA